MIKFLLDSDELKADCHRCPRWCPSHGVTGRGGAGHQVLTLQLRVRQARGRQLHDALPRGTITMSLTRCPRFQFVSQSTEARARLQRRFRHMLSDCHGV